jgi:PKD repeat protein
MGQPFSTTLTSPGNKLSQGLEQPEIQITTGVVSSPLCPGSSVSVPFTADGYVDPANVYTAQLSDSNGNFASPIILGSLKSTAISGTIIGTVPNPVAAASGYLVRVVGSAPVFNGITTTTAVTIDTLISTMVSIDPSPTNTICADSTVTYTATGVNPGYSPSYQWQLNNGSGFMNIPGATGRTYTTNTQVNNDVLRCLMSSSVTCPSPVVDTSNTTTEIVGYCNNAWLGNSTDWFATTNWSAGVVPSACADGAIIPSGLSNYPVLTGNASLGDIVLQQGASINLAAYNLSVCGNWTTTGTGVSISSTTGLLIFNGAASQLITGTTTANEVKINNTSGGVSLALDAALSINTALDLQNGNMDVTYGNITFISTTVSQVAILDNFSPGFTGTITGNIKAQRYYAASSTYNQHFMGSPVNTPSFAQFGDNTGSGFVIPKPNCDESQMAYGSPYGVVFSYHENPAVNPRIAVCGEAQWEEEAGISSAVNAQGYSVLKDSSGTLELDGSANLDASYTLSGLTNSNWSNVSLQGRDMSSGWQLVSNPYLATLQVNTTNTGFDNQIQVWNCNGPMAGTYQPAIVGTNAVIAPFQAFMVHVTHTTPLPGISYTIKATDRVRTAKQFYAQMDNELDITAQNITTGFLDVTVIAFNSNATDAFDPEYDAIKFGGSLNRHTLYSLNNNKWMARNILNSVNTTATVAVGFEPGATGPYSFSFGNLATFDPTSYIYLEDKQAGVMYNVRNGNYQFSSDSADEWNRFILHFTPPASIQTISAKCNTPGSISVTQPGAANWNYVLIDANNVTMASGILNQSSPLTVTNLSAGNYTLNLTDNSGYAVSKAIVVGGATDLTAGFNMPATATVQSGVTFVNTSENAVSYTWYISDGTTITDASNPTHKFTKPGVYTVMLVATNAAGCTTSVQKNITVNESTGLSSISGNGAVSMWSYENKIYVDFTQVADVNAVIKIYDILGREISNDKYVSSTVYEKEIDNMEAACVIVSVINDEKIVTRKLSIFNTK